MATKSCFFVCPCCPFGRAVLVEGQAERESSTRRGGHEPLASGRGRAPLGAVGRSRARERPWERSARSRGQELRALAAVGEIRPAAREGASRATGGATEEAVGVRVERQGEAAVGVTRGGQRAREGLDLNLRKLWPAGRREHGHRWGVGAAVGRGEEEKAEGNGGGVAWELDRSRRSAMDGQKLLKYLGRNGPCSIPSLINVLFYFIASL